MYECSSILLLLLVLSAEFVTIDGVTISCIKIVQFTIMFVFIINIVIVFHYRHDVI